MTNHRPRVLPDIAARFEQPEGWQARAACAGRWDLFDLDYIGDVEPIIEALSLCDRCPVIAECERQRIQHQEHGQRNLVMAGRAWVKGKPWNPKPATGRGTCRKCGREFRRPPKSEIRVCKACRDEYQPISERASMAAMARWGKNAEYSTPELREAHRAYMRGERDAETIEGERAYQAARHLHRKQNRTPPNITAENVEFLLANGVHGPALEKRLDLGMQSIQRACQRAGRPDLARRAILGYDPSSSEVAS